MYAVARKNTVRGQASVSERVRSIWRFTEQIKNGSNLQQSASCFPAAAAIFCNTVLCFHKITQKWHTSIALRKHVTQSQVGPAFMPRNNKYEWTLNSPWVGYTSI